MKPILSPRLVTVEVRRPHPALLGSKEQMDAFTDEMIAREMEYKEAMKDLPSYPLTPEDINRMAAIDAERVTEGQRLIPRPNYRRE